MERTIKTRDSLRTSLVFIRVSAVVDLQGFSKPSKSFVVKELAILCDGMVKPLTFTFAPPFPWYDLPPEYKWRNAWVERHYTGHKWNSGTIPFDRIEEILYSHLKDIEVIYVKGREKVNWLRTHLKPYHHVIKNLENDYDDDAIPSLRKLTTPCFHHKKFMCVADNVIALSQWVALKPAEEPSADRSIRLFQNTGRLDRLTSADLACLPKAFLLHDCAQHTDENWARLPEKFKDDPEIVECRRCFRHYNTGITQYDRPPQMVKDCYRC